ncbi:hypothetical protein K439DRAFT_1623875 [Ramaria rubella]|nr:hypothetical protein K439DRAFT_1623875 [Ramaria rubella]
MHSLATPPLPPLPPCSGYSHYSHSVNCPPPFQGYFCMCLPIACFYALPEYSVALQPYCQALLFSELLVVAKINLLFWPYSSEFHKCKYITPLIGILPLLNMIVRKNVPESPLIAGSSHIPNPQSPNPSPQERVADIHAQLAAIQQQQPPPARQRQQSAFQTGLSVNSVPLGVAGVAQMHAQADALRQQQTVQSVSGVLIP